MSALAITVPAATGISGRDRRDRLELLTALLDAPGFDPVYRPDVIEIPACHPVYGWACQVQGCECVARSSGLCQGHEVQLRQARRDPAARIGRAEFLKAATPLRANAGLRRGSCQICPGRPERSRALGLCERHFRRWETVLARSPGADFNQWLTEQSPFADLGICLVPVCADLACSPARLCNGHAHRYWAAGSPGNMRVPELWFSNYEARGLPVPVLVDDEAAFRRWCSAQTPFYRSGIVNLTGLQPLAKAEIKWGMHVHAQAAGAAHWDCSAIQHIAIVCRADRVTSLFDLADRGGGARALPGHNDSRVRMIAGSVVQSLWCVYYSEADSRDAGFIETDHFGRRFNQMRSHYDLTGVSQRWLRNMLWDHVAAMLRDPKCPRSRGPLDNSRRAAVELSAFLEAEAPESGHDPALLREEHAQRFVADQRHRARHSMQSLGVHRSDGKPSTVTETTRRVLFNYIRQIMRRALETGTSDSIGLAKGFVTAFPGGGPEPKQPRGPFSDDVAHALSDEGNLRQFAEMLDPADYGLRDAWETILCTGRRCREVLNLRLDCTGRYRGLAMLWHDQTKVGNLNDAIRIPEYLYQRLTARQATTLARFEDVHGRPPEGAEREAMALFPSRVCNPHGERSISYQTYSTRFRQWVNSLDLGRAVSHQARHTLATNLLRAGATLAQIRRYLGQVSERMAEHYVAVSNTDLEDVLNLVWVAGPGSASPGKLLSGGLTPMSREEAMALALDLNRRSTPTHGGLCTYQPVVSGGTCPWNLDCDNCDKFVLSGADLLYWRRKQEQWRSIAERAPDDATADYLHRVFEPTARAIDGLEKALAGLGLLDRALALDFRRPQDYFDRVWSIGFRPEALAEAADDPAAGDGTQESG